MAVLVLNNLFVAMLLENVQISLASQWSMIQSEHCDRFKALWDEFVSAGKSKKTVRGAERLNCYDVFAIIKELDEPLGRIVEMDAWQQRLLMELRVGLKANRRTSFVTFSRALMAVCTLYLSNSCLPYELQHRRMLEFLHQKEETATRLIQCRVAQFVKTKRIISAQNTYGPYRSYDTTFDV